MKDNVDKKGQEHVLSAHSIYIQHEERKIKQGELCVFSNLTGTLKFVFLAARVEAKVFFYNFAKNLRLVKL